MASKIDKADAQEWLESLQQVGEGWYRQVALAVRANAHKALGMERREFAQAIGQRMIDPREAIVELHQEGHAMQATADVLGVSHHTVKNVLIAEGLVEGTLDDRGALPAGTTADRRDPAGETTADRRDPVAELAAQQETIEQLQAQVKGARKQRQDEFDKMRDRVKKLEHERHQAARDEYERGQANMTDQQRELVRKEAEAYAQEEGRKVLAGLAHFVVDQAVGGLEDATEALGELRNRDAVTAEGIAQIDQAHARFVEELGLTKMLIPERR